MDPDPSPDPTPDPTPFFSDFKDVKKNFFHLPTGIVPGIFYLKIYGNFLLNFLLKVYFATRKHYFSPLNTFMRKEKDPDPEPDPYL
jgi:hypothetical protein